MRRMICIASGFLVTLMTTLTVQADDHMQVPAYGGVEVFGCDFAEGKDMGDLLDVSKKRGKWASKNNSQPYSGYLLQPYYYDDLDDEIYWVGFSPSLAAQGIVQAEWLAKGGELQQEFDSIALIWTISPKKFEQNLTTLPITSPSSSLGPCRTKFETD